MTGPRFDAGQLHRQEAVRWDQIPDRSESNKAYT